MVFLDDLVRQPNQRALNSDADIRRVFSRNAGIALTFASLIIYSRP